MCSEKKREREAKQCINKMNITNKGFTHKEGQAHSHKQCSLWGLLTSFSLFVYAKKYNLGILILWARVPEKGN